MPYLAVIKRFKTLLRFVEQNYCWRIESGWEGLGMALNEVFNNCMLLIYRFILNEVIAGELGIQFATTI